MKLADIFGSNMVFQAEKPLRFFGTGKGTIEVRFASKKYSGEMTQENWVFEIEAQPYGEPMDMVVSLNGKETTFTNCVFGDVFLLAGQSNMQFMLCDEIPREKIVPNDHLRYFFQDRPEEHDGIMTADGWRVAGDGMTEFWPAIGYHATELYSKDKGVYVGSVGCFQGASGIRSWLPKYVLDEGVNIPSEDLHWDYRIETYTWNNDSELYFYTFLPLVPFSFKGVVWYQGESDTSVPEGKIYKGFLERLVYSWRKELKDDGLQFVIVRICDFDLRDDDGWKGIQRAQTEFAEENEGAFLVTSDDVCEHAHIHPEDKRALSVNIAKVLEKF